MKRRMMVAGGASKGAPAVPAKVAPPGASKGAPGALPGDTKGTASKPSKRWVLAPVDAGALVFAYGSNMRVEQMRARCPSAVAIEVVRLRGAGLAFVGFSRSWGGAVASIVQDPNDSVDGMLYRVSLADLDRLDMFEGAPHVYRRSLVTVSGKAEKFKAWVYAHSNPRPGAPSYRYFAAIIEGRARVGLDSVPVTLAAEAGADFPPF